LAAVIALIVWAVSAAADALRHHDSPIPVRCVFRKPDGTFMAIAQESWQPHGTYSPPPGDGWLLGEFGCAADEACLETSIADNQYHWCVNVSQMRDVANAAYAQFIASATGGDIGEAIMAGNLEVKHSTCALVASIHPDYVQVYGPGLWTPSDGTFVAQPD